MKKIILSCLSATLLFTACNKSDGGSGGKSKSEILTTGKWLMTAQTSQTTAAGVAGPITDDYSSMSNCEKDDYTFFNATKYIVIDEGATKCNSSDPQTYNVGTWALTDGDTKMRQTNAVITIDWTFEQLDDNTLKMSNTETDVISGITVSYKTTETFKHVN